VRTTEPRCRRSFCRSVKALSIVYESKESACSGKKPQTYFGFAKSGIGGIFRIVQLCFMGCLIRQCSETVLIVGQYAYRGAEMVVIPQPDGSVACIPARMTHESAAHHQLHPPPRLSLDTLRSLRAEIDVPLRCLQSDSCMENVNNEAQEHKH
jgi:hypothetical protein